MVKYYCDKCGEELQGDMTRFFKVKIGYGSPENDNYTSWMTDVFCDSCGKEIKETIDNATGIRHEWY